MSLHTYLTVVPLIGIALTIPFWIWLWLTQHGPRTARLAGCGDIHPESALMRMSRPTDIATVLLIAALVTLVVEWGLALWLLVRIAVKLGAI